MFDELNKYKNNDHFFFTGKESLGEVCNAPKNKSGVYVVYELKNGRINLVYIGSSGKVQNNGKINHGSGLFGTIVHGLQFGDIPRKESWQQKVKDENIDALDIYWYDTFNSKTKDIPVFVDSLILQIFFEINGKLPKWNTEL